MHSFDNREQIWDQRSYEVGVRTEADLLIALEAMKSQAIELNHELDELSAKLQAHWHLTNHSDNLQTVLIENQVV